MSCVSVPAGVHLAMETADRKPGRSVEGSAIPVWGQNRRDDWRGRPSCRGLPRPGSALSIVVQLFAIGANRPEDRTRVRCSLQTRRLGAASACADTLRLSPRNIVLPVNTIVGKPSPIRHAHYDRKNGIEDVERDYQDLITKRNRAIDLRRASATALKKAGFDLANLTIEMTNKMTTRPRRA